MNANIKEAKKAQPPVLAKGAEIPPVKEPVRSVLDSIVPDLGTTEREFDRTFLGIQHHGRALHRDYSAHFYRWSFARRHIPMGSSVIDVGCGPELPLFHVLQMSPSYLPSSYIGVDLNRLSARPSRAWAKIVDRFDFTARWNELPKARDFVVCFEVIEHMQPESGLKLLKGCHGALKDGGTLLLSTPVFNGKQARNHIHEYEIDELQSAVEGAGFAVERRFGTFMSKKEMAYADADHQAVYDQLSDYYDNDALACIFAPLYPDLARNNLWVCRKQ